MTKRLSTLLVALLALGFAAAGCGGDDEDKAEDSTPPSETKGKDSDANESGLSTDSGGSGAANTPQTKQAVEQCKRQANANPQLSSEAKSKIGEVCEEAAQGDSKGAQKATREACRIIVEDTAPEGRSKDTALKACDQSTATP
jgi:ribosomal protein S20